MKNLITYLKALWSRVADSQRKGVGVISEEGAIEHPFSTYSAPFGTCWQPSGKLHSVVRCAAMLVMFFTIGSGNAWGATSTITLTQSNLELTGSYSSGATATVGGVTFTHTDLMKNSDNIQVKASTGVLYNSTAMPGKITNITITHTGTARSTTVYYGTSAQPSTNSNTFSGSCDIDVSGDNTYFKITRGSNAAYWSSVEITYETAPASACTVTFTKTDGSTEAIKEASAGAGVTPPVMSTPCDGWAFQGWSTSQSTSTTSTTVLSTVTLTAGKYYPTSNVTLYPVYTKSGGSGFSKYELVSLGGAITAGQYLISTGSYTMAGDGNSGASFTPGTTEATSKEYTIAISGSNLTIKGPDNKYIGGSSGSTTLSFSASTPSNNNYKWKYTSTGIQFQGQTTRYIRAYGTTDFRNYTTSNGTAAKLYKRIEADITYYYSYPSCVTTYTVDFAASPAGYGSVSPSARLTVPEGTSISASGSTLTVGSTDITASPAAQTAQYTYAFSAWSWSPSGATISGNTTATATFTRSTRSYSVTTSFSNGVQVKSGSSAFPATLAYGGSFSTTLEIASASSSTYELPTGITVTGASYTWDSSTGALALSSVTGNVTVTVAGSPLCVAPTSVTVDGTWRRFPGETITLTAEVTGGTGTPSYQWQKYIVDTWTDIDGATAITYTKNNCTTSDAGQYRCVVTTGTNCSTASDGFNVRIYTLEGKYEGGADYTSNDITVTSGTTGTATVTLTAGSIYRFKVVDHVDKGFGNNGRILKNETDWSFGSDNANDAYLFTGPAGTYTFTVNTANVTAGTPYVTISVAYPEVPHPAEGYAYYKNVDSWGSVKLHMWYEGGGEYTAWASDPVISTTATICNQTYYYTPLIPSWYNRVIFHNGGGDGQTGNIQYANLAAYSGKYNDKSDANWHNFNKYTVSYDANGGTGSMGSHTELCPGVDQTLSANTFTKSHYHFTGWVASADVTINSETVTAGTLITGTPTIQNVQSDITLTAQWEINSHTLTWDWGGGSTTSTTHTAAGTVAYGTTITYPANNTMSKSGYAFAGWSSSPGTMPDNNLTITAQWNPQVTWMAGGEVFDTQSGTAGTALTDPGTPSNSTYCDGVKVFVGWSASEIDGTTNTEPGDLFTSVAGKTIPAGGTTYYAVFATRSGSETDETITIDKTVLTSYASVDKSIDGIAFKSTGKFGKQTWSTYEYIQCENGKTLYNNEAFPGYIKSVTITPQSPAGVAGYVQLAVGTSKQPTSYSANVTTTTTFGTYTSSNNYTYLQVKANGASAIVSISITYVNSSYTYSGYATTCCQNWEAPAFTYSSPLSAGGSTVDPTITGTTYGTPTFSSSNTSAVTVIESGTNAGRITPVGAGTAKITATWPGDGTHCSKSVESNLITVNGNFSVSFNGNGGTGSMSNQSIPSGTPTNLTSNAFTAPSCKTFYGWATSQENANNDVRAYTDGQSVTLTEGGLTLYAIWHTIQYTVARGSGTATGCSGGTFTFSPSTVDCGGTVTVTSSPDANHKGSPTITILPAASGTTTPGSNTITNVVGNITSISVSYAEKEDVTATWHANNGSVTGGGTTTQKEGSMFTFPNVTSTDCGTFLGWTNAANSAYNSTSGRPATFYTVGSTIVLDDDADFYAVYSKVGDNPVAATLYAHDGDVNSITNTGYTNVTVTTSGITTTNTTDYKTKFDDVGDYVIFQLDGTPTSVSVALQTPSNGTAGTSTITLYEAETIPADSWSEITSTSITSSSTSATLSETTAANFTHRVLKLEMTSKGYNVMCGDITINGLQAPINYTTNPACVDWVLDAISVTTAPTKTTYNECDEFDPAGMVVTATMYENGNPSNTTTKAVAGYTCSPIQFLTPGNPVAVTISYTEKGVTKTTTQNVTVTDLANYTVTFHDGNRTPTTWTQTNHCESVDLDDHSGALECGDYTFVGWSTSSTTYDDVSATISTWVSGSYTPTANTHLYAVYRKGATPPAFTANCEGGTFYIYEANGNTHMAGRVNATPRAYTSEYWNNDGGTGCVSCLEDGDDGTPFTFTRIADNTYKIQNHDGEYLRKYSSGNHPDFESTWHNEDNFKWIISAGTNGTWRFTNKAATDYALVKSGSYFDFQLASNVTALSSYYDLELTPAASTVYQSNPNCGSPYTITFETHGGSFVQGNYSHSTATTSGLTDPTVSQFPSATKTGCTFVGWKEGNAQDEITSNAAEADESDAPVGLYAADAALSVSSDKTYHAVYHYYDDDWTFDPSEGGTYHMYTLISGTKHYVSATPTNSWTYLTTSTDCEDVTEVTVTPGTGANAGKYTIAVDGYNIIPENGGTKFKRGDFWWTITARGDGTYAINGMNDNRNIVSGSSGSQFEHCAYNAQGAYSGWYYPYFGRCRQHHWTSTPTITPLITLGQTGNIYITSTNGKTIKATNKLTLSATRYGTTTKIYLSANVAGVGFLKADGTTLPSDSHGTYVSTLSSGELETTNIVVTYSPTVTTDGIETVTITAQDNSSPSILATASRSIHVRHLPAKFLIATKVGDDWYALPNNMTAYGNPAAIKLSSVNEATGVATYYSDQYDGEAVGSKNYLTWALYAPVNSDNANYGYKQHGDRLRFADTYGTAHYLEFKASDDDIKNSVSSPNTTDHPLCELLPTTSDLIDYTLLNEGQNKYLGVDGSQLWGAYAGSTTVRFLIPDQQAAPTITWYNDMLDANHTTNKAENGVVTLPTGADPVSCNEPSGILTFDGWVTATWTGYKTTGFTKVVGGEVATSNTTYYAVFKTSDNKYYTKCPTIYSITYTPNGGTGSNYVVYTMNTTADAVTVGTAGFEKSGSTFVGWTNPDDVDGTIITPGAGKITGLSGNITLNAVWIGTVSVTGTVRLTASAGEKVATGATDVTISSTDLACATALRITYKDVTNNVTYGRSGSPSYTSSEFRLCNGSYGSADGGNIDLTAVSGAYNQTFSMTYEPNGGANTLDEYELKVEVLLKNTVIDTKTLSLYGRTLPASFAIAIKVGGSWYALPNNMGSEGTYDPILISVTEDANVLNWTAQGPSTAGYKMKDYTPNYSKLRFAANDANEYCLWAATGNAAGIRNYSASSTDNNYAWTVTSDANFNAYTMANLANTRTALKIYNLKWEMYNTGGFSEIHFIPFTTVTPIDVTVMEWGVDEIAVKTVASWNPSAITAQISGGSPSAVTKTSIGGDLYKLTGVGDLQGNPGEPLALNVTDGGAKQAIIQIPFIVTDTKTEAQLATILKDAGYAATLSDARNMAKDMDVIVRRGGTLSSNSSTSGTFKDLYIYPGGKADFTKNISIQNIYMRGGFSWLGGSYAHPQMNVASSASISGIGSTGHGVFYDLYLDNSIYYVFALPKDVAVTAITNEENGDDWDAWIKSYSGQGRTLSPKESGWHYVTSGSIARGAGYEIAIKPRLNRPYGILRFPLLKSTAWSSESDCTPEVTGWGANNTNVSDNNKGWNFVGNPFLTAYNNEATPGSSPSGLMQTKTLVHTDTDPWDGKWKWATSNVKYFTVPRFTEYEYDDVRAYPYELDAFFPFFIQVTGDGTVSFAAGNKALKMPSLYANETQREVMVDFTLENPDGITDMAGLTISNQYSEEFDMNDKEKTIQNGNATLKVYTMVGEFRTAFNSLPEAAAALPIPVGYIAPQEGKYKFSLAEGDYSEIEHVWLTDTEEYITVDLLDGSYEFQTEKGANDTRLELNVILSPKKEDVTTGTDIINTEDKTPLKFLHEDKMFIRYNGIIYDATGKRVR